MKKIILSFLIILSILLVACQHTIKDSNDEVIPIKKIIPVKQGEIKDPIEYIGDCDSKDSEFQQDTCWIQKAALTKNIKICETKLTTENKDGCYGEVAVNARDPNICGYTSNPIECKRLYAMNVLDVNLCDSDFCRVKIPQWLTKYSLKDSDCEQLTLNVQNSAFSGANDYTKQQQCFEFLANLELVPKYCEGITFEKTREKCKTKANKKDFTFEKCSTRMGYSHYRDVCFYQLSKQEKSIDYCEYIILDILKNRCLTN